MEKFESNFIKRVMKNIKEYDLLRPNDKVVIGVSGGADSTTLLDVIYKISTLYGYHFNIIVAHVNHQIRKGGAERDEEFVRNLAKKYDTEFVCRSVDVEKLASEKKISCEEAGREVRYGLFYEIAGKDGKILTAHNANDNAETVLMRIFRGTGLNGLCGISYKNGQIVRPILNIPRKEIEMYTKICHLEYMTDETNLVPIYTRNKIRLNVIPMIEKEFNKKFCSTMNDSIKSFNEDMEFINSVAYKEYTNITRKIGNGIHIETDKFLSLPKSIQKRIVMIAIEDINGSLKDVSTVSVNLVCDMFKKETGHITPIKNNVFAYKDYDAVIIAGQNIKRKNSDDTKKHIVIKEFVDSNIVFCNSCFKVSIVDTKEATNTPQVVHIPISEIENLVIRTKTNEDVFEQEKYMHKKLNLFMKNKKIPANERNNIPILCKGNTVYWIPNYASTRLANRSGKFVRIEILNN